MFTIAILTSESHLFLLYYTDQNKATMSIPERMLPYIHKSEDLGVTYGPPSQAAVSDRGIWQAKAPDETVQLSREQLTQVTRDIVPELIDDAIAMKQTNQLAKQVKRLLAHCGQVQYPGFHRT